MAPARLLTQTFLIPVTLTVRSLRGRRRHGSAVPFSSEHPDRVLIVMLMALTSQVQALRGALSRRDLLETISDEDV